MWFMLDGGEECDQYPVKSPGHQAHTASFDLFFLMTHSNEQLLPYSSPSYSSPQRKPPAVDTSSDVGSLQRIPARTGLDS